MIAAEVVVVAMIVRVVVTAFVFLRRSGCCLFRRSDFQVHEAIAEQVLPDSWADSKGVNAGDELVGLSVPRQRKTEHGSVMPKSRLKVHMMAHDDKGDGERQPYLCPDPEPDWNCAAPSTLAYHYDEKQQQNQKEQHSEQ